MRTILRLMGRGEDEFDLVADRAGHDLRYAVDAGRLRNELGWLPSDADFEAGLAQTVAWYTEHQDWWRPDQGGGRSGLRRQGPVSQRLS